MNSRPWTAAPHMFASRTNWNLAPNRLAAALAERRAAGTEVLDLTESNPTRCGVDYDQQRILRALSPPEALHYQPESCGMKPAREAVAEYYREQAAGQAEKTGTAPSADGILLTSSSSESYSFLFRLLCEAGDEVLVPAPSYPLLEYLASLQDVRLLPYPLLYDHGWQLDLAALEATLTPRARAVVVVHPNNPTGSFVKPEEAEALASLCARNRLAMIADEVFLDFAHDGVARRSFAGRSLDGRVDVLTFVLSGLSKTCGLPQLKLGWIALGGPSELAGAAWERLEVIADTYLSVSMPSQLALPQLLADRARFQRQVAARIAGNLQQFDLQLTGYPQFSRLESEGGWYTVLRVPAVRSDEETCLTLLREHGVLVHPGHFFDFPGEGHLVLSLIPPAATFAEGIRRVLKALEAA